MASGDVIRLVNVGDSPFSDQFNGRRYLIPPGGSLMVDFDAICLWLGHPESNNFDHRNRVRLAEYHRIRTRYGVDARALEMATDHTPFDDETLFKSLRPKLEAFNMANERLLTVADDPDGNMLAVPSESSTSDIGLLMARLQAMEREQENLRSQLAAQQRARSALDDADPTVLEDLNPNSPGAKSDIVGTVTEAEPAKAPEPPARSVPSEDTPTRIRVTP